MLQSACTWLWVGHLHPPATNDVWPALADVFHPEAFCALTCAETNFATMAAAVAEEALRRAKFKFPGRQKIVASRNW